MKLGAHWYMRHATAKKLNYPLDSVQLASEKVKVAFRLSMST